MNVNVIVMSVGYGKSIRRIVISTMGLCNGMGWDAGRDTHDRFGGAGDLLGSAMGSS